MNSSYRATRNNVVANLRKAKQDYFQHVPQPRKLHVKNFKNCQIHQL